jgi:hypothetical protein
LEYKPGGLHEAGKGHGADEGEPEDATIQAQKTPPHCDRKRYWQSSQTAENQIAKIEMPYVTRGVGAITCG